jgi:hypothetical protein
VSGERTVQYRVAFGKKDERVSGPDDADLVITVAAADAALDPTVAYMQGRLKATGHTGLLFEVLRSGEASAAVAALAATG